MAENYVNNAIVNKNLYYEKGSIEQYQILQKEYLSFFDKITKNVANRAALEDEDIYFNLKKLRNSLQKKEKEVFSFILGKEVKNNSIKNAKLLRKKISKITEDREIISDLEKLSTSGLNNLNIGAYIAEVIRDTGFQSVSENELEENIFGIQKIIVDIFEDYNFSNGYIAGKIVKTTEKKGRTYAGGKTSPSLITRSPITKNAYQQLKAGEVSSFIYEFLNKGQKAAFTATRKGTLDLLRQVLNEEGVKETLKSTYVSESKQGTIYFLKDQLDMEMEEIPLFKKTKTISNPLVIAINNIDPNNDFKTPMSTISLKDKKSPLQAWQEKPDYSKLKDATIERINQAVLDWVFSGNGARGLGLKSKIAKDYFINLTNGGANSPTVGKDTWFLNRSLSTTIGNLGELYSLSLFTWLFKGNKGISAREAGKLKYADGFKKGKQIAADMILTYGVNSQGASTEGVGVQIKHFLQDSQKSRSIRFVESQTLPSLFLKDLSVMGYSPSKEDIETFAAYLVNNKQARNNVNYIQYLDLSLNMDRFFSYFTQAILDISLLTELDPTKMTEKNVGNLFYLYELNYFIPASVLVQNVIDGLSDMDSLRVVHASNTTDLSPLQDTIDPITKETIQNAEKVNLVDIATISIDYSFIKEKIKQFNILEEV